ncbi:5317_t:CDS:2 [Diversispora eburnea]|uniref:5317_t:CDS:1 n=1 Tax=Diversispora eburnea TaxID=1213867 RepID=A0A9N9AJN8_9GLOM|nr:5317_t:CDS:2 [Diversispora eburnea]
MEKSKIKSFFSYFENKFKKKKFKLYSRSSPKNSEIKNVNTNSSSNSTSKIINYVKGLLEEHGNEIHSEFFKSPEEPAKLTIDEYGDSTWTGYGESSMSAYDTAWLAMVPNKAYKESAVAEEFSLAFPKCFKWLFDYQDEFGGWCNVRGAGAITPVLAGLSALCHFRTCSGAFFEQKLSEIGISIKQFYDVINKATEFARVTLNEWNINDIDLVGLEIIIPYHLNALKKSYPAIEFEFPEKQKLLKANERKLSLIPLEAIFKMAKMRQPISLIYSLEAFSDVIDFSRVQNEGFQALNGSYGSSAAATAAVLIHAKQWDDKAYSFLENILQVPPTRFGYVPSVSDIGIFESAWVLHSIGDLILKLKKKNITDQELFSKNMAFAQYLQAILKFQGGKIRWISWDSRIPADVDDTAVSKWIVRQFDSKSEFNLDVLMKTFYNDNHFITFPALLLLEYERAKLQGNPSITVPVITKTGLTQQVKLKQVILNVIKFLMAQRTKNFVWLDKWNKSPSYTTFKVIDILLSLISHPELLEELNLSVNELKEFCRKSIDWALNTQHEDESWGEPSSISQGNMEETSYIIRLLKTGIMNWPEDMNIHNSLRKGQNYLMSHLDEAMCDPKFFYDKQPFLWIGKQMYTVPRIIKAAMLVAAYEE